MAAGAGFVGGNGFDKDFYLMAAAPPAAAGAAPVQMRWHIQTFRSFVTTLTHCEIVGNQCIGTTKVALDKISDVAADRKFVKLMTPIMELLHFDKKWKHVPDHYFRQQRFLEFLKLFKYIYNFEKNGDTIKERLEDLENRLNKWKKKNWKLAKEISGDEKILNENPDEQIRIAIEERLKPLKEALLKGEKHQRVVELRLHAFRSTIQYREDLDRSLLKSCVAGLTSSAVSCAAIPKLFPKVMAMRFDDPDSNIKDDGTMIWIMIGCCGFCVGMAGYVLTQKFYEWLCQIKGIPQNKETPISFEVPESIGELVVEDKIPISCCFDKPGIASTVLRRDRQGEIYIELGKTCHSCSFDFNNTEWPIAYEDLCELQEIMFDMLAANTLTPQECFTIICCLHYGAVKSVEGKSFLTKNGLKMCFDIVIRRALIILAKESKLVLTGESDDSLYLTNEESAKQLAQVETPGQP